MTRGAGTGARLLLLAVRRHVPLALLSARILVPLALLSVGLTLLTGCGVNGGGVWLPGAVGGAGSYPVTAAFDDVSNLVPQETCRAGDVVVGNVSAITLGPDLRARVTCAIDDAVSLPANAVAAVRETSLLGERFVALDPPAGAAPTGRLAPGTAVPSADNPTSPGTEQVLGALSSVLTGGNLGAFNTVTSELNQAMTGHEDDIRTTLTRLNTFTGQLDTHRADITRTLDSLDRLAGTVARQRDVLGRALDTVPDGLAALNDQRSRLLSLLDHLRDLSDTARPVLKSGTDDIAADLHSLDPILDRLAAEGHGVAPALEALALPIGRTSEHAVKGDFGGFFGNVQFDVDALNAMLSTFTPVPIPAPPLPPARSPLAGPRTGPVPLPGRLPGQLPGPPLLGPHPPDDLGGLITGGR